MIATPSIRPRPACHAEARRSKCCPRPSRTPRVTEAAGIEVLQPEPLAFGNEVRSDVLPYRSRPSCLGMSPGIQAAFVSSAVSASLRANDASRALAQPRPLRPIRRRPQLRRSVRHSPLTAVDPCQCCHMPSQPKRNFTHCVPQAIPSERRGAVAWRTARPLLEPPRSVAGRVKNGKLTRTDT